MNCNPPERNTSEHYSFLAQAKIITELRKEIEELNAQVMKYKRSHGTIKMIQEVVENDEDARAAWENFMFVCKMKEPKGTEKW